MAGASSDDVREDLRRRIVEFEDRILRQYHADSRESRRYDVATLLRSSLAFQGHLADVEAECARAHVMPGAVPNGSTVDRAAIWARFIERYPHAASQSPGDLAHMYGMRIPEVYTDLLKLFAGTRSAPRREEE